MSTSIINEIQLNSSQELVQTDIEENENKQSEMDHLDLSEVSKNHRNLIAFFLLGICNTFLSYITIVFQIMGSMYHSTLFLVAIPIGIIQMLPLFISAFMKYN